MDNQHLLRYQFPNIDQLPQSYSQVGQDLFVLSCLKGQRNGRYCEIGAYHPFEISNTYVLEKYYNWAGISFDINQQSVDLFNQNRVNKAHAQDAMNADYANYFQALGWNDTKLIDYASVDCEPPENTLRALQQLMLSGYKFKVITFEHDTYQARHPTKEMSRVLLKSLGYTLIVGGIMGSINFHEMEDWWVHPELVDMLHVEQFRSGVPNVYWHDYIYLKSRNVMNG